MGKKILIKKKKVAHIYFLGLELLWMLLYISPGVYPKVGQGQSFPCVVSLDR